MDTQYIDIQNVYDYMQENGISDYVTKELKCTPPFENTTLTWKNEASATFAKCHVITEKADNLPPEITKEGNYSSNIMYKDIETYGDVNFNFCSVEFYSYNISDDNLLGSVGFVVDHNGKLYVSPEHESKMKKDSIVITSSIVPSVNIKKDGHKLLKMYLNSVSILVAFSFALMNVKNIKLIDKPVSRQVRRRKERKGEPFYKVLSLEPFKTQVRNEARERGQTEMQRALHICRGHFVTYSEERPLFGKYAGTYWKPAHMRGNAKNGEVVKDYKIDL